MFNCTKCLNYPTLYEAVTSNPANLIKIIQSCLPQNESRLLCETCRRGNVSLSKKYC